jgi:serine/threonine-protein kinase HipA
VVALNHDDHPENIAYLMSPDGAWNLAPAFDAIWAYNPNGQWTNRHQMSINGKRDDFTRADLVAVGRSYGLRDPRSVINEVIETVSRWADYTEKAGVLEGHRQRSHQSHRLRLD